LPVTAVGENHHVPPYLLGLRLAGRRVLVVGGGRVAQRRVPALLDAGADVVLVAPAVTATLEGLAGGGRITWHQRPYKRGDCRGAWLVQAVTDDAGVNADVVAEADAARIWAVRADDAAASPAWTPASGHAGDATVGVLLGGDPRRAAGIRDAVVEGLRDGALESRHSRRKPAGVALVGGGPGDPGLITVRGRQLLAMADVVVRLKGGDPFVFGRGGEEAEVLVAAGIAVEVVPGVSSSIAAPAAAGIPVTMRGIASGVTIVTAHQDPGAERDGTGNGLDWDALARSGTTLVVLMGAARARQVSQRLIAGGMRPDMPVAVITSATNPDQLVDRTTLAQLGEMPVCNPSTIVIGEVAALDVTAAASLAALAAGGEGS
jgi:uroporphyrin-III C-methyltransferase/precorrin-2 dehydrogenase/sirohydrochlorin ferrochelatase